MANYCWNSAVLSGDKAALDEIQERFSKHSDFNYFIEFGDYILKKEVATSKDDHFLYGTKWWEFEMERTDVTLTISGDSAWGPPLELLRQISEVYDVTIEGEYDEPGMDFAGFFTCKDGNLEDREMTSFEFQLEGDRDYAINEVIENLLDCGEEFDEDEYPGLTEEEKEYIKEQLKQKE